MKGKTIYLAIEQAAKKRSMLIENLPESICDSYMVVYVEVFTPSMKRIKQELCVSSGILLDMP